MPVATSLSIPQNAIHGLAAKELHGHVWSQATGSIETVEALRDVLPGIVNGYGMMSATVAADWFDQLRETAEVPGKIQAIPADLDHHQAVDSLIDWASAQALDVNSMRTLVEGGMNRRIDNWSRQTVVQSVHADPHAVGWKRVGQGDCRFCQMLIGRGAVYTETTAVFRSHDNCHCSAAPAWNPGPKPHKVAKIASKPEPTTADKQAVKEHLDTQEMPPPAEIKETAAYQPGVVDDLFESLKSGDITAHDLQALADADGTSALAKSNAARALSRYQGYLQAQEKKSIAKAKSNFWKLLEQQKLEEAKKAAKEVTQGPLESASGVFDPLEWKTVGDARDWAYSVWGGPQRLTQKTYDVLYDYTGMGYRPINRGLRSSKGKRISKKVRLMDEAIDNAPRVPHDIIVTRNANLKQLGITGKRDPRTAAGAIIRDDGYMSTSVNRTGAMSGEVKLKIRVPKGSKGIYVSGDRNGKGVISSYGRGESELILARGSSLRIESVVKRGKKWVAVADLIQ